jgi:DNA-binding response OmpR family regulator
VKHVPIVMLTAFDGNEYRNLAAQAGCNAFIVKPPDFDVLRETLDRLLQGSQAEHNKAAVISNDEKILQNASL